jgi:hypothetical protein
MTRMMLLCAFGSLVENSKGGFNTVLCKVLRYFLLMGLSPHVAGHVLAQGNTADLHGVITDPVGSKKSCVDLSGDASQAEFIYLVGRFAHSHGQRNAPLTSWSLLINDSYNP